MTTETSRASSRSRHGTKPAQTAGAARGKDLPRPPRRVGQWTATILFVLLAMLAAGWIWQQKSERLEVLVVRSPIAAGEVVERSDLGTAEVAGVSDTILATDADAVVGKTAAVGLVPGQVLGDAMVVDHPVPNAGQRVVGVELDATRAPSGLVVGDEVMLIAVPPSGDPSSESALASPRLLAEQASVLRVGKVDGGNTRLSLVLPRSEATKVAAFGAAGRIAVVQTPLGGDG